MWREPSREDPDAAHVTGMSELRTPLASGGTLIRDLHAACVFDLETTGVDVLEDRIVTAFVGRVRRDGSVDGSYSWLVNPGVPISEGASAIHGVTDAVAERDGTPAPQAIAEILAVLRRSVESGRPTVAYNASFDLSMLNAEARRYSLDPIDFPFVVDPFVIDKAIDRYRRGSRKLIDTARHYGVPLDEEAAHDAEADAVATGRVAWAVIGRLGDWTLQTLHDSQVTWAKGQASGLEAHLRRTKDPEIVVNGSWPVRV